MPTFRDPLTDAAEASEAMRGLAHASRVFDDPADTYTVFGDLTATMRSLRQVLDQLANTHLAHRDRAQHDDGDHLAPVDGGGDALEHLVRSEGLVQVLDHDDRVGRCLAHLLILLSMALDRFVKAKMTMKYMAPTMSHMSKLLKLRAMICWP